MVFLLAWHEKMGSSARRGDEIEIVRHVANLGFKPEDRVYVLKHRVGTPVLMQVIAAIPVVKRTRRKNPVDWRENGRNVPREGRNTSGIVRIRLGPIPQATAQT